MLWHWRVMAIEEKGMTGKIKVYGIDAQGEALDAVEKGTMSGTVFQNAEKQGSECVDVAIKAAGGETLENNYYIPYEGVRADSVDTIDQKRKKVCMNPADLCRRGIQMIIGKKVRKTVSVPGLWCILSGSFWFLLSSCL